MTGLTKTPSQHVNISTSAQHPTTTINANIFSSLSALSRDTPVKTSDASHRKTTLNNTLKVLIKFALIERTTESHNSITPLTRSASTVSSRTSTNRSLDTPGTNQHRNYSDSSDSLDLLRIHSVLLPCFLPCFILPWGVVRMPRNHLPNYAEGQQQQQQQHQQDDQQDGQQDGQQDDQQDDQLHQEQQQEPQLELWHRRVHVPDVEMAVVAADPAPPQHQDP
ncbi:hypothetical protein GE21DRAFT_3866 [Neurospora crassa]|uniref:Uncharacterized protein n=1 Tax=Neurospora crassa (strain ATCC 24698 / 74-OR23-1A / CBS 708.71 / DSM 1257 / FGSC 987) TaxID=367110 RepID=Q7SAX1_NEUCR|nr:hypothetical protein NCU05663 [Neurospora crassa OR74A]EAA33532.1 hypothetical protein NCU05663 [Neurospora crassa OR74A]KHE83803.1 hypothetical protein GE21DRAFT_3866 [Neurospora crassa]|eukprot:XP_962768.1 hypothetical protein NCU05663 [Neurospora crassa OR74A]